MGLESFLTILKNARPFLHTFIKRTSHKLKCARITFNMIIVLRLYYSEYIASGLRLSSTTSNKSSSFTKFACCSRPKPSMMGWVETTPSSSRYLTSPCLKARIVHTSAKQNNITIHCCLRFCLRSVCVSICVIICITIYVVIPLFIRCYPVNVIFIYLVTIIFSGYY